MVLRFRPLETFLQNGLSYARTTQPSGAHADCDSLDRNLTDCHSCKCDNHNERLQFGKVKTHTEPPVSLAGDLKGGTQEWHGPDAEIVPRVFGFAVQGAALVCLVLAQSPCMMRK